MFNFIKLSDENPLLTLHFLPDIKKCFDKYSKYLLDDFFLTGDCLNKLLYQTHFFWVVSDNKDNFMGFAYLDNFIGNEKDLYSAELTVCFDKKAWGNFIRFSAKFFFKKCFDELGLHKIKAQIYPDNFRVRKILKDTGFVYESLLKNETLRFGKMQDIEVYALYRNYYYKD
ncbi:GNAT family N-acetyltransferase [bacterium]|nr:GNAT family N-acetyltransferase [bacterium]